MEPAPAPCKEGPHRDGRGPLTHDGVRSAPRAHRTRQRRRPRAALHRARAVLPPTPASRTVCGSSELPHVPPPRLATYPPFQLLFRAWLSLTPAWTVSAARRPTLFSAFFQTLITAAHPMRGCGAPLVRTCKWCRRRLGRRCQRRLRHRTSR